jgi:hypothetical protein
MATGWATWAVDLLEPVEVLVQWCVSHHQLEYPTGVVSGYIRIAYVFQKFLQGWH